MNLVVRKFSVILTVCLIMVLAAAPALAQRRSPPSDCIVAQIGQFLAAGSLQHNVVLAMNGVHRNNAMCNSVRTLVRRLPDASQGTNPVSPFRLRSGEPRSPELLVHLYRPRDSESVFLMRTASTPLELPATRNWQLVGPNGNVIAVLDIPVVSVGAIETVETRFRSAAMFRYNATNVRENDRWLVAATHASDRSLRPPFATVLRFAYPFHHGTESLEGFSWCFRPDGNGFQLLGNDDRWSDAEWVSLGRREVLLSIPEGVASVRGTIYRVANASCDVSNGGVKTIQRVDIAVRARRQSFRVPIARTMGVSDPGTRLFLVCDNLTALSPSVCDGTLDSDRITQSNGVVAPVRQRTCELRLYDQCTAGNSSTLSGYGPQRFHVTVKNNAGTTLREFDWFAGREVGLTQQMNLGLADISDENDALVVFVKEQSGDGVSYNDLDPEDAPQFNFSARIISRGTFGFSLPLRTFVTVQTSPFSLRLPAAVRDLERSSDSIAIQTLPTRVGLFAALEPWDYVNRRHLWPVPLRFIVGGYFLAVDRQAFWPSLAAGVSVRQPILEANPTLASSISFNLLYELDLRGNSPSSGLLLTASLDLFSFFSPRTTTPSSP